MKVRESIQEWICDSLAKNKKEHNVCMAETFSFVAKKSIPLAIRTAAPIIAEKVITAGITLLPSII